MHITILLAMCGIQAEYQLLGGDAGSNACLGYTKSTTITKAIDVQRCGAVCTGENLCRGFSFFADGSCVRSFERFNCGLS